MSSGAEEIRRQAIERLETCETFLLITLHRKANGDIDQGTAFAASAEDLTKALVQASFVFPQIAQALIQACGEVAPPAAKRAIKARAEEMLDGTIRAN